jgi:hypothetical protein
VARYYKRWEDHSPRWQREQSRKGLDKKRWNAWLKLSDKTRKSTTPDAYAAGKSVADQRVEGKIQQVVNKMLTVQFDVRPSVIRHNVGRMSEVDLNWTLKASPKAIRQRAGDKSLKTKYRGVNPWWYR